MHKPVLRWRFGAMEIAAGTSWVSLREDRLKLSLRAGELDVLEGLLGSALGAEPRSSGIASFSRRLPCGRYDADYSHHSAEVQLGVSRQDAAGQPAGTGQFVLPRAIAEDLWKWLASRTGNMVPLPDDEHAIATRRGRSLLLTGGHAPIRLTRFPLAEAAGLSRFLLDAVGASPAETVWFGDSTAAISLHAVTGPRIAGRIGVTYHRHGGATGGHIYRRSTLAMLAADIGRLAESPEQHEATTGGTSCWKR